MVLSASTVNGLLASACHVLPPVLGKFRKYLDSKVGGQGSWWGGGRPGFLAEEVVNERREGRVGERKWRKKEGKVTKEESEERNVVGNGKRKGGLEREKQVGGV